MSAIPKPIQVLAGVPEGLRNPLLQEYDKLVRNYREGRWEPAELNGGKFSEVVYTILKGHVDCSFPGVPSKPRNMVDACKALEGASGFPRSIRIQIPQMLAALYEIRNQRNVGHVGADVDPSHMDATVVLAMVKWVLAELIRIFHGMTTEEATKVVEGLVERTLPIVWKTASMTRVLGSHLGAKERMLALLYGTNAPIEVREIVRSIGYSNITQFRKTVAKEAHRADLVHWDAEADTIEISPVGIRYVEENVDLVV